MLAVRKQPSLAVLVSIWNEPENLLRQNAKVFSNMKYKGKHQVYWILHHKDKKTIAFAEKIKGKKIKLIISPRDVPLKAAGINYAIKQLKEEIFGSFDVDNIPSKDYYNVGVETLLSNKGVGLTIGGEHMFNKDQNLLTAIQDLEQRELFFSIKNMVVVESGGYIPVAGAGYFMRKKDFLKVKGLSETTVTEDADLTIRLLKHKLKGIITSEILAIEATPNLIQVIKQRIRWRKGVFMLFRDHKDLKSCNVTIHRTYVWTLVAPLLTMLKFVKYPMGAALATISPVLGLSTLIAMIVSDLEVNHWELMKRHGIMSRKLTYPYMFIDIVYMLVLILAYAEYKISPMKWHLTKKEGSKQC